MPRIGMQPVRRKALIAATIDEIGARGSLDVTVARIARRAGVSSALAHHYFGNKEQLFLAAMRQTLSDYRAEVRAGLSAARGPRGRVEAIVRAGFSEDHFRPAVLAAWLNFYVLARTSRQAERLLTVYHRRIVANLSHALRPLAGDAARDIAETLAAVIDGVYLREGLGEGAPDGAAATRRVLGVLDAELAARGGAGAQNKDRTGP
ncbi:transcriptional regulator BetI [Rhodosalinus sediminis]|uniref:HTH-type transcriptional regulator BetI n=1 Tax=Rhodosalinus sediminis TaxID=1940533 RepID=A0A3D9BXD9_9RHOB|nr:transcriptional regulator BetI [Rhodosalinus sediminis]REC58187.1 transcriptional regulator BetI [Rhodosalinus sediminis]